MPACRFIHAADLHLDSPFTGLSQLAGHERVARALREATFQAFEAVVRLALDEEVDFVLLAGDIYDARDRSVRAQLFFRDQLARLGEAGIRSYVVHGNHDPLSGWSASIRHHPLVTVFGAELAVEEAVRDGEPIARILGRSYGERAETTNPATHYRRPDADGLYTIGLLHASVGDSAVHSTYAPCSLAELLGCGLDYVALGHIHQREVLHEEPWIVYPGNPQGRHVNEAGPRGCCLVAVDDAGGTALEFRATDAIRWARETVDLEGADVIDEVRDRLAGCLEARSSEAGRPLVIRLEAVGSTSLDAELRGYSMAPIVAELRESFAAREPFVWLESVRLQTRPVLDLDARAQGDDFVGTLLRLAARPEAIAEARPVLADVFDHYRLKGMIEPPGEEELAGLLDEARRLAAVYLESEG